MEPTDENGTAGPENSAADTTQYLGIAGESLRRGTNMVQGFVSELWEGAKYKALERCERASAVIDQPRVQRVLGHRVSRAVLDSEDAIILDQGDFITLAAIEHARESGVLKSLLSAVDRTVN